MVKFGLKLNENRASDYPPDAYLEYDALKDIIKDLGRTKLAKWVAYSGSARWR